MLLLDDVNEEIAREYEISFEEENVEYVISELNNLLAHPIIVSSEIKKGLTTDLSEDTIQIERDNHSKLDKRIILISTESIRQISDYVKIADVKTEILKYKFLFTINFISRYLPNIKEVIKRFDYVSAEYVKFILEEFEYSSFNILSSLLNCYNISFNIVSKFLSDNQKEILINPEVEIFSQVFSHATLTEISGWLAPFSIRNEEANIWRYDEADREVIENSINVVRSNQLIAKTLGLKPYRTINKF